MYYKKRWLETIKSSLIFKILEVKGKDVLFETQVQAGTYIRTLCLDIGKEIGDAHMLEASNWAGCNYNQENQHVFNQTNHMKRAFD